HYCYLPLYAFCANGPQRTELRDCKRDGTLGTVEALEKIVPRIRNRFGKKVHMMLRGDGGFCRECIMSWCERRNSDYYRLGQSTNPRLRRIIAAKVGKLHHDIVHDSLELPTRRFTEFRYTTLDSWSRKRRVIAKLEVLEKGENPRFIVTNLPVNGFADD